jgi:DNA polymerase II large subunit
MKAWNGRKIQKKRRQKMKIGIDLDDVVVDYVGGLLDFYNKKFNKNLQFQDWKKYSFSEAFEKTKKEESELIKDFQNTELFNCLKFVKGAEKAINKLAQKYELFLITSREEEVREHTEKFIEKLFPDVCFFIHHSKAPEQEIGKTKADFCKNSKITFLIEDNPKYAKECAEKGTKVLLLDKPWNQNCEGENIIRLDNWNEILNKIGKGERGEKSPESEKYFKNLEKKVKNQYLVAEKARKKGLDPADEVEAPLAMSLAEKSIGLVSTIYPQLNNKKVINKILELEEEYGQLDAAVSFKIAEEVAKERFCKFKSLLQAIDAGIRVGFAYNTLGVVASPIEGYTELKLGKTRKGEDYFIACFSGPIRSAGTTATCLALMIIDYLRELFGFAKYDPNDEEVKRYITEIYDFHERITNLQYIASEEEIEFLAKNMPIQISGDPTEDKEVSNYKDLTRVNTNYIRGGMCLCLSEGLAQKAQKGLRLLKSVKEKGFKSSGWDFLEEYIEIHKRTQSGSSEGEGAVYIKDLVAGRPVYGHPSRSGSFRFRYGRARVSGFSAVSIHPATMGITNNFLSSGTQLKIEKPSKGCIITSCDSIDGPIVKFKNGSVKKINDFEDAKKSFQDIDEIIYLGDLLFPLGDIINRNHDLLKPGYVEEWWKQELDKKLEITGDKIEVDKFNISFEKAAKISEKYSIPLHPSYIFYWTQISVEDFFWLLDWLQNAVWRGGERDGKLVLPYEKSVIEKFKEAKRALEILGVEHEVVFDNIVIDKDAFGFLLNLGLDYKDDFKEKVREIIKKYSKEEDVLEIINKLSKFKIKDKAGTFIGARMGRPEKAKLRKLTGSPNVLFPIGEQGGRFRSVNAASEVGYIKADFPVYFCENCGKDTIYNVCENCGKKTKKMIFCPECRETYETSCPEHGIGLKYFTRRIDSKYYLNKAMEHLGFSKNEIPELIKGVRGTSSEEHDFENLAKGILRAKHNLCVNKDGTVRYDSTEIPITHFKPKEIGTSVEKLKELGYERDIYKKDLENDEQILELFPHDIILSSCPETKDEKADDVFFNIANFIDELLEKFYRLPKHYNLKSKQELVGQLAVCMSPHNCAGVVGRIIGFSKLQGLIASPYMHAAVRRDCDGDEAAVMLLLDVLLNFSVKFLPAHRGGKQDAPLVLNARIRAGEVDDQILDFETCSKYPLKMYELAEQEKHSSEVDIENVKAYLKEGKNPFINIGFTHDSGDFNSGVVNSSYKTLPTMKEKVGNQMELVLKLRAVDHADVARLVIERHFIRDIRGNLRRFSQQQFRCVKCNEKFRRPPMQGVCTKCGGKIIFTISEGSIVKYLEPALELADKFDIPEYTKQCLELAKVYIESLFGKETEKQEALKKWF